MLRPELYLALLASLLQGAVAQAEDACPTAFQALVSLKTNSGPGFVEVTTEEKQFVEEIKTTGSTYQSEKFWSFFERHPKDPQQMIAKQYEGLRPGDRQHLSEVAARIGHYATLMMDPGVAQRSDAFEAFTNSVLAKGEKPSLFQLRKQFSDQTGKVKIWHGALLSADEAAATKANGIVGSAFYNKSREAQTNAYLANQFLDKGEAHSESNGAIGDIGARLRGANESSLFSSHSKFIEVTYAGAWKSQMQHGGPIRAGDFYLFEIDMPALDVVKADGIFSRLIEGNPQTYVTRGLDGNAWRKSFADPDFEVMTQFVPPEAIVKMQKYDGPPPKWSN